MGRQRRPPLSMYIGRFAPSPSGPLHFGSLVCALASYLDARFNHGKWLLRIENIDPPRETPESQDQIISALRSHKLIWDDVSLQSNNSARYRQVLAGFEQQNLSYRCSCNRKRIVALAGRYDGHCILHPAAIGAAAAIRLRTRLSIDRMSRPTTLTFSDPIQGEISEDLDATGDFIIHRKDGLFAYQLAVSCDDFAQGITHVVRGSDLLTTTPQQILLMELMQCKSIPQYAHIPAICHPDGKKLSKQTLAPPLDESKSAKNLFFACKSLGLTPPQNLKYEECERILTWATEHWSIQAVPKRLFSHESALYTSE
ncbi:MAG: glutamyl-Q tRNA(Asp) synthetase [Flavobacteriales bacterium]